MKIKKIIKILILTIITILIFCFIMKNFFPAEWSFITPHKQGDFVRVGDIQSDACGVASQALDNGKVLLFCGKGTNIYNPKTRTFRVNNECNNSSATRGSYVKLNDGSVLIFGGVSHSNTSDVICKFNPEKEEFLDISKMLSKREGFTSTLLNNGKVFIAGGHINNATVLNSTEIFDPVLNQSVYGPNLLSKKRDQAAILIDNLNVLLIGGSNGEEYTNVIEQYNFITNEIIHAGKLVVPRANPKTYKLKNGKVLITSGWCKTKKQGNLNSQYIISRDIELYDPKTRKSEIIARRDFGAEHIGEILLPDDTLLFYGGSSGFSLSYRNFKDAAIFNPETAKFKMINNTLKPHPDGATSVVLKDGNVLIMGGGDVGLRYAEIYMYSHQIKQ